MKSLAHQAAPHRGLRLAPVALSFSVARAARPDVDRRPGAIGRLALFSRRLAAGSLLAMIHLRWVLPSSRAGHAIFAPLRRFVGARGPKQALPQALRIGWVACRLVVAQKATPIGMARSLHSRMGPGASSDRA